VFSEQFGNVFTSPGADGIPQTSTKSSDRCVGTELVKTLSDPVCAAIVLSNGVGGQAHGAEGDRNSGLQMTTGLLLQNVLWLPTVHIPVTGWGVGWG